VAGGSLFRGGGTHVLDRHPPPRRRDAVPHRLGEQRERDAAVDRHEPAALGASAPRAGTQVDRSFTRAASSAAWVAGVCGAFCKGSRLERRASFGAWSEKASRTKGSACSSVRTCSASPDVETVTCDTGTASPAAGWDVKADAKQGGEPLAGRERGRVHPRGRPARGSPVIKQRRDGREGSSWPEAASMQSPGRQRPRCRAARLITAHGVRSSSCKERRGREASNPCP